MSESDDELMARCKNDDMSAFDLIVQRYKVQLINFACRFVGDPEAAEDVAQETFIRIYQNIKRYRRDVAGFRTWMYRIAANLCKNELRNRNRRLKVLANPATGNRDSNSDPIENALDTSAGPHRQLEGKELQKVLAQAISRLPEKLRTVLILRDIEGMPYEEIDMDGRVVGIITAAMVEPRAIDFMLRVPELSELRLPELRQLKIPDVQSSLYRDIYRDQWSRIGKLRDEMIDTQQQLEQELKTHLENVKQMSEGWMREWESKGRPENIERIREISEQWAQMQKEHSAIAREMAEMSEQLTHEQKELARNAKEMAEIGMQWAQIQRDRSEIAKEVADMVERTVQEQKELLKNATARVLPRGTFFGRREESFAIPINFAKMVMDDLMEDGEIDRGWLGMVIRPVRYWDMERLGLDAAEGVIVTEVMDNSPAARAEIRKDDVIINFGGEKVKTPTNFIRMVSATKPHTEVSLTIIRDKQKQILNVEIGKGPKR